MSTYPDAARSAAPDRDRPRVLFICGNRNHNTMMARIGAALPEVDAWYTPYFADDYSALDLMRRAGLLEFIALGNEFTRECLDFLSARGLQVDHGARRGRYDLVLTCSDLLVQKRIAGPPLIGVQEGMIDPPLFWYRMRQRLPWLGLPRWAAGTACTGLSGAYHRYCLASDGYRDDFIARGAPPERLVVTGLPNFDDFRSLVTPGHWIEGHVLACTSDGRETLRRDDRHRFIIWCRELARGRPLVFKFHPNEDMRRAAREVEQWAPGARWIADGSGEELAANCEALVTEWSTLAYVGLVLGKESYSYRDLERHRRMAPLQHGRGAQNIADVCRDALGLPRAEEAVALDPPGRTLVARGHA